MGLEQGPGQKGCENRIRLQPAFSFEYDVYKEAGAPVEFVGHPLLDIVHPAMTKAEAEAWAGKQPSGKKLVLLMPGSRLMKFEMLPTLLAGAKLKANSCRMWAEFCYAARQYHSACYVAGNCGVWH